MAKTYLTVAISTTHHQNMGGFNSLNMKLTDILLHSCHVNKAAFQLSQGSALRTVLAFKYDWENVSDAASASNQITSICLIALAIDG